MAGPKFGGYFFTFPVPAILVIKLPKNNADCSITQQWDTGADKGDSSPILKPRSTDSIVDLKRSQELASEP